MVENELLRAAKTAHLDDAMRNLAPALLRLWRAAVDFNDDDLDGLTPRSYAAVSDALRELEAHKP